MKAFILALCLALCGCASVGDNFDSSKVAEIEKGVTTEIELINKFGRPAQRGVNNEGRVTLTWMYTEAVAKGESFIPIAGAFVGGTRTKTKFLLVEMDPAGKVATFNYSGSGYESSGLTQADPEEGPRTNAPVRSPKGQ